MITAPAINALTAAIHPWIGTPYRDGHNAIGVGIDCVRFVVAILDQLYRITAAPIPVLPPDTSLHDPRAVARIIAILKRRYPVLQVAAPGPRDFQPGDIAIVRYHAGAPGHVGIIGADTRLIFHAINDVGVSQTSVETTESIIRAYRPQETHRWAS